jgi:hypothetical protein
VPDVHAHVGQQPVHKITKATAHYTDVAPAEYKAEPCKDCTYFERIEPDHCSRVRGVIAAGGHCKLWEK